MTNGTAGQIHPTAEQHDRQDARIRTIQAQARKRKEIGKRLNDMGAILMDATCINPFTDEQLHSLGQALDTTVTINGKDMTIGALLARTFQRIDPYTRNRIREHERWMKETGTRTPTTDESRTER